MHLRDPKLNCHYASITVPRQKEVPAPPRHAWPTWHGPGCLIARGGGGSTGGVHSTDTEATPTRKRICGCGAKIEEACDF